MEIPVEKLCNFFKCYDSDIKQIQLNCTGKTILSKVALHFNVTSPLAQIKMIPIIIFFHVLCIGQLGHLIHYLQNNPFLFFDVVDDISVILTCETASIVCIAIARFTPELGVICKKLGNFQDPDLGKARGIEALDKLFSKYIYTCLLTFMITCTLTICIHINEYCAPDEVSNCGFLFMPYLPYIDIYNNPSRQIMMVMQCLSGYSFGALSLVCISQIVFINEVLILRFSHLQSIIKRIPNCSRKKRSALIGRIVRYHNYLTGVNTKINQGLGKAYALHLCITPVNISFIAYQLLGKEIMVTSLLHLFTYLLVVILTCGSGERLTTYTEKLHDTIFESIPMDDIETAKNMKLILFSSEKPLVVLAGGITAVNHVLMGNIFKTVWSTLTVLNRTGL